MALVEDALQIRHSVGCVVRGYLMRTCIVQARARASSQWIALQCGLRQLVGSFSAIRLKLMAAVADELDGLKQLAHQEADWWARRLQAIIGALVAQPDRSQEQMTAKEVAEEIGISRRQVFEGVRRGTLPFSYTHGRLRIRRRDLEVWGDPLPGCCTTRTRINIRGES